MREDICTIPISEAFEGNDGCPICRMRKTVEERILDYIMGAAMMEPDIRIETNKKGFCLTHYCQILGQRNRLSVALMMESHLEQLEKDIAALEEEKKILEGKLSGGEISSKELGEASVRIGEVMNLLDEKELRWLELNDN